MSADPSTVKLFAGRYRLGPRRGNNVEVATFDATDVQLRRRVMLKIVHPQLSADAELMATVQANVEAVSAIRHPNLAHVLDVGESEWNGHRVRFVVEEFLSGGSLRELLDRGRVLTPSQALLVGLDACRALDALHRAGLVHGDVRPATMVFGDDRRLRLVDAALAAPMATHLFAHAASMVNDRAAYASPEQAQGKPVLQQSDVYALSLSLVEAVTGSVPFLADSAVATLSQRINKLMPVSADLGALAPVLERAGRPIAEDRSTAAEFGRALMQAAEKLPRPAPLPLVGAGLFADTTRGGQPVEPTGPLLRPQPPLDLPGDEPEDQPTDRAAPPAPPLIIVSTSYDSEPRASTSTQPAADPSADTALHIVPMDDPLLPSASLSSPPAAPAAAAPTVVTPTAPATVAMSAQSPPGAAVPARRGMSRRLLAGIVVAILAVGGGISWWLTTPTTKEIPSLTGLTEGEALNVLDPLGFEVTVSTEASDTVDTGDVIRTEPAAGTVVNVKDPVRLVVSSGPAPRELPELTGLTVTQARQRLESLGLVVDEADPEFDETVATGVVLRWVVPDLPTLVAGDMVPKGTTVQVVASAGPEPRVVPDLRAMSLEAATAELQALGLKVAALPTEFSPDVAAGLIARQVPAAGEPIQRGGTVSVALSKGPDLVPLPTLDGLTVVQATQALAEAGLVAGVVKGDPTTPVIGAQIGGQAVAPGTPVPRGSTVDLITFPTPTTTTSIPAG
jgi:serine/threonine-protein kinase